MNIIEVSQFLRKHEFTCGLFCTSTDSMSLTSKIINTDIFISVEIPFNEEKDYYDLILSIESKIIMNELSLSKNEFKANLAKAISFIMDYIDLINIEKEIK